ncbi:hypothetical protein C8Q78DRAFT_1078165 [Trametes maxima]|nr:hypothetical protein C8Q78DRAFT_1078165 [Trametes maxima]
MDDILVGGKADWIRHYTSNRIGEAEVDAIVYSLQAFDQITRDDKGHLRWNAFPVTPSELYSQGGASRSNWDIASAWEDDPKMARSMQAFLMIFQPLGHIIDAITRTALPGLSPSCKYTDSEELCGADLGTEVARSRHHTHGYMQLIESASPPTSTSRPGISIPDVAVNFEFQLADTFENVYDNRWKVLHSASRSLHSDCRRKHTYGITIENNNMAMWYFSRSHSAKSEVFDLLDVRSIVWALSSLIFSTVEELGYDADIRRITENNIENKERLRYVYRMGDVFYKTLKCLDEYDDSIITGRATRVWEVVRVHSFDDTQPISGGEHGVLRDVWLEYGADTESDIQHKIFHRCEDLANSFPADDDPRLLGVDEKTKEELRHRLTQGTYKDLFLTIEADYRGSSSKPTAKGFVTLPDIFDVFKYGNTSGAMEQDADAYLASASGSNANPGYEVCTALHELDDLHTVMLALYDCLLAVQILFLIRWIHRDISSGNLLFHQGHGKLGDLEYAKEFNLDVGKRSSDPKTGTPIFMAIEVQSGYRIYIPTQHSTSDDDLDEMLEKAETSGSGHVVRHNFQHDLESFFWIMTWLIVTRIEGDHHAEVAALLFRSRAEHFQLSRQNFLLNEDVFLDNLRKLRAGLPRSLRKGLLMMRTALCGAYLGRGARYDDISTYSPLYDVFRRALDSIASVATPGQIHLVRPPPARTLSKSGYDSHHNTARLAAKLQDREGVALSPHKVTSLKRGRDPSNVNNTTSDEGGRPEKRLPTNDPRASEMHSTE